MESHVAARVAAEHGLPFAVLRVVSDPAAAGDSPPRPSPACERDGRIDVVAVLRSLANERGQLPQLMRVAADAARAYLRLLRCHRRLGAGFGFIDFS